MTEKGALLLLPNLLGEGLRPEDFFSLSVFKAMESLDGLLCESEKAGRRYLKYFKLKKPPHHIPIALYNEHTSSKDFDFLLEPILKGEKWGLISDAGLPCICDPGYDLVAYAKSRGIAVEAFTGPSSIVLALMLSGLPGQRFAFHGYLDRDRPARLEQMKRLFQNGKRERSTQIFIEAPYRNTTTFQDLLQVLGDECKVCVAWDLTLPSQKVETRTVKQWKATAQPEIEKKPAIFLLSA